MKLYFSPGACSLSPHIVCREAGLTPELIKVDLRNKQTELGDDYFQINPNGYVPALVLDDGSILTEVPAIVQYLADQVPEKRLAPPNGTLERYRLQSMLNFITAELHKSMGVFFNPNANAEWKDTVTALLRRRFGYVNDVLAQHPYALGDDFTVADAYLFTILSWCKPLKIDLSPWPRLGDYLDRIAARPAVQEARRAEGLL